MTADRAPREDLVTVSTAARAFAVTRHTVLRWIHAGRLPASRYPMGQWRVSRAAIAKIQATRRHT